MSGIPGPRRFERLRFVLAERRYRRLLGAQLTSQFADGLYQIALASVLIFGLEAARTPFQVTKVLAVTLLPFSLIGPFTGPFIDRFSRRSILVVSSVIRTVLTVALVPALALGWPEEVILVLAVANVSVNRFFHATKNAVLPTLVRRETYLEAVAVSSTAGMVIALSGAVVGGPLADAFSPAIPIALAVAFTAASAVIASTLPLPRGEREGLEGIVRELRDNLRDVRDGLGVLVSTPRATYGVASSWGSRWLHGFILLAALVVGRARFDIGAAGFSVVLAAAGVGGFVGAVLAPVIAGRVGRSAVAPLGFAAAGVATMIGGPIPAWGAMLGAVAVAGLAATATKIASEAMIMRSITDHYRGRTFAVYDIGYHGVFVAAALVASLLRPVLRDAGIIVLTAVLYFVLAGALAAWRRRLSPDIEVESYAGARADESPRAVVLDGVTVDVADVERSWHEERDGGRRLRFRLRLADGRRIEVSRTGRWSLDRFLPA